MRLTEALNPLFKSWVSDRELKPGLQKIPLSKLAQDFQNYVLEKGVMLPVGTRHMGKFLSKLFFRVQLRDTTGKLKQHYLLNRTL